MSNCRNMLTYGITNRHPPRCATARKGTHFNPHQIYHGDPNQPLKLLGRFNSIKEATAALELYTTPAQGNC